MRSGLRIAAVFISVLLTVIAPASAGGVGEGTLPPGREPVYNPAVAGMISTVDASDLSRSTRDLENISTRQYLTPGNGQAATYIVNRLSGVPGLEVAWSDGQYRNIIATLRGTNRTSGEIVVVGAHYDSTSLDPGRAPGATDNGCGVATVLALARVMSGHRFDRTIQFAFWNAEENGLLGSYWHARNASASGARIPLYLNYDAGYYDPEDASVLDLLYDESSEPFARMLDRYNSLYDLRLNLTFNRASGWALSDYYSFWQHGYPAIGTYSIGEPPQTHTPNDTSDQVSYGFAVKGARLGLVLLAETAGMVTVLTVPGGSGIPSDVTPRDGNYEDVNGNGRKDFADVVLYFNQMGWIAANEPIDLFDCNDNGRIDFADVVWLFNHL